MGRKNWLFANTPAGAQSSAVIYSLIETAKENELDPYRYLLWVLQSAPVLSQAKDNHGHDGANRAQGVQGHFIEGLQGHGSVDKQADGDGVNRRHSRSFSGGEHAAVNAVYPEVDFYDIPDEPVAVFADGKTVCKILRNICRGFVVADITPLQHIVIHMASSFSLNLNVRR